MDAIEAAKQAMKAEWDRTHRIIVLSISDADGLARAAISAYLEATGSRQQFEAWAKGRGVSVDCKLNEWTGNFEFVHEHVQSMWFGWTARGGEHG